MADDRPRDRDGSEAISQPASLTERQTASYQLESLTKRRLVSESARQPNRKTGRRTDNQMSTNQANKKKQQLGCLTEKSEDCEGNLLSQHPTKKSG